MIHLSTCTSLSCLTECWVCVVLALAVGAFFGVLAMGLCVAARDADDARLRDDDGRIREGRVRCPHCGWVTYALGEPPWHCAVCQRDDMKESD